MKKTLSLILAAVLAFGGAVSVFAAENSIPAGPTARPVFNSNTLYKLSDGLVTTASAAQVANSKSFFVEINTPVGFKAEDMKKYKVRAEWSVGKELIEKVSIVYKKAADTLLGSSPASQYSYYAEIKPKAELTVSKNDIVGTLTLYKSSTKELGASVITVGNVGNAAIGEVTAKFGDGTGGTTSDYTVHTNEKVVSFGKGISDITIIFDGIGEMDINVESQDKLYLGFNRDRSAAIDAMYPTANMDYVNFVGSPAFNRTGIMNLYAEDLRNAAAPDTFLYAVDEDGVITAVKSTFNEELQSHKFAVRKLANTYIISDRELELDEAVTETPVTPDKTNPNTGR